MESIIAALIVIFGAIAMIFGVMALGVIINGYVLSILWVWFLVPLGLPILSVAHAIGVAMVTSWLTYQYRPSTQEDKDKALEGLAIALIVRPLSALGIGYIVKQFM